MGLRVLLIYSFGASFVTFYRVLGPFKSPVAPEMARTELVEIILRRGILGNIFFGLIPMLFHGFLNAVAFGLDRVGLIPAEGRVV